MPDRISTGIPHDDRDGAGRLLGGTDRACAHSKNEVHSKADQLGRKFRIKFSLTFGKTSLNDDVLSFNIAKLA